MGSNHVIKADNKDLKPDEKIGKILKAAAGAGILRTPESDAWLAEMGFPIGPGPGRFLFTLNGYALGLGFGDTVEEAWAELRERDDSIPDIEEGDTLRARGEAL